MWRFTWTDSESSISTVLESYCRGPVGALSITHPLNHHVPASKGKYPAFMGSPCYKQTYDTNTLTPDRMFLKNAACADFQPPAVRYRVMMSGRGSPHGHHLRPGGGSRGSCI